MEGARIMPVFPADITAVRATTAVEYDTQDTVLCQLEYLWTQTTYSHKTDHSNDLDKRESKLCFTIALDTKHVDGND